MEVLIRVHVTLDVQLAAQTLGPAEENTSFRGSVDLADRLEDHIPVWTTKVGRSAQARDRVLFGVGIVDHDVCRVIDLDLGSEVLMGVSLWKGRRLAVMTYCVNLNVVLQVLGLDSQKERPEPLQGTKVSADPKEVHLPQPRLPLWIVHPVPNALQNRGERRHTDTRTNQNRNLELEDIL